MEFQIIEIKIKLKGIEWLCLIFTESIIKWIIDFSVNSKKPLECSVSNFKGHQKLSWSLTFALGNTSRSSLPWQDATIWLSHLKMVRQPITPVCLFVLDQKFSEQFQCLGATKSLWNYTLLWLFSKREMSSRWIWEKF